MGFELEDQFKLTFQDVPGMAGLEVVVLPMSIETALLIQELQEKRETTKEDREDIRAQMKLFADHIVSWNLERGGEPVPASLEEVKKLRPPVYRRLVREWDAASAGVSAPLDGGSTTGADSDLEASIPMETLSPSPSS